MKNLVSSAIILAIGIVFGAYFIYLGINGFVEKDRYVAVKGLAEREVMANEVVWPLSFKEVSNDFNTLYETVEKKQRAVVEFLEANGIPENEIIVSTPSINDRLAEMYGNSDVKFRYQGSAFVTVSSKNVEQVIKAMSKRSQLFKQGIAIESQDYSITYNYTLLNELKPSMIEEATQNARKVAEKFAQDAQCDLGSIQYANQGQFSIVSDENTPQIKKVRVVTTINYYLK